MSHFTTLQAELYDEAVLIESLEELCGSLGADGVGKGGKVRGYHNSNTDADIVLLMPNGYDVGFKRNEKGRFDIVADWYGVKAGETAFLSLLFQHYAEKKIRKAAQKSTLTVLNRIAQPDGSMLLTLEKSLMSEKKMTVEIKVDSNQDVDINVIGGDGKTCKDATREIEAALGKVKNVRYKPEYNKATVIGTEKLKQ